MAYRFTIAERERLVFVGRYMVDNLHLPLPLYMLCRLAIMNRHKLNAGFERLYGKKVKAYLLALRMEKARALLQGTDDRLEEIAAACGYGHASNLGVVYKRYFGYPPSTERRRPEP